MSTIKAEKNDAFWDKFRTGQALPKPNSTFATQKMFDYLTAAGVKVRKDGKSIGAAPLTDRDILHLSHGELKHPTMLDSKNLEPEKGGLFDTSITGGLKGTHWSHYKLAEPVVNPLFEKTIPHILGIKGKELTHLAYGELGVKKVGQGKYHLINTQTGKLHRELDLNHGVTDDEEEDDDEIGLGED